MTLAEIAVWIVIAGFSSFVITYTLATRPSMVRLTTLKYQADHAIHSRPTPRIGGLAVVATSLIVVVIRFPGMDVQAIVFSCLPIVLGGLLEDFGIGISPRNRLTLAALCGLALYIFTGTMIDRVGLPGVDAALSLYLVGLTFTVFLLSGITHAFNLVDGLNGLLAAISIFSSLTLAALAVIAGDQEVAMLMVLMASITVGFGAMNFPFGKVFMGDTGSYFLGFSLGATGVYLISRHDDLSPWSVLLALFWPFHETVLTVARRVVTRKRVFSPDQEHTHHLVLRLVRRHMIRRNMAGWENPMSTVVLLPFILAPNIFSLWSWNDPSFGLATVLSFLIIYTLGYVLLRSCASDRGRG